MTRSFFFALLVLGAALPAAAERPADVLARLRGELSTNTSPIGSAFPKQYVEAYRFTPRPPAWSWPGRRPHPPAVIVISGTPSEAQETGITLILGSSTPTATTPGLVETAPGVPSPAPPAGAASGRVLAAPPRR